MVKKVAPQINSIKTIGILYSPMGIEVRTKPSHQLANGIKASFTFSSKPFSCARATKGNKKLAKKVNLVFIM